MNYTLQNGGAPIPLSAWIGGVPTVPQSNAAGPAPSATSTPVSGTNGGGPSMSTNQPFNWNIEELGNLINTPASASGGIDQVQASPETALQNQFMQTPAYQLMYGNNTAMDPYQRFFNDAGTKLRYGDNSAANPADRFRNDEGTQLAIQQGMQPLLGNFAAAGLGQSGALAKSLSDYQFKNYNDWVNQQQQSYQNYVGGQGTLFNNYQNQLASLTGMGAQNTGSTNAYNSGNTLATLLSQAQYGTGQSLADAILGTGNNISSLYGNQGVLGASAYLNTGSLLNQNTLNGLSLSSQLGANQQASQATTGGGLF